MTNLNPVLKQFLNMVVTPERVDMLGELADFLTEIGDETFTFAVDNILARYDNEDPSVTIADIEGSLRTVVCDILQSHGVLVGEPELPYLGAILRTLIGVPNYGDPGTLLEIIDGDNTPESALAELTELFSPYDSISVIHVIAEVKYTLIESMREVLQTNLANLEVSNPVLSQEGVDAHYVLENIRNRTRVAVGDRTDYILQTQLKMGMPLGLDMDYYVDDARSTLETLEPEELTHELIVMAYASDMDDGVIQDTVKSQLEAIVGNIGLMTKANIALESALGVNHG